jgi:hypothetical protein
LQMGSQPVVVVVGGLVIVPLTAAQPAAIPIKCRLTGRERRTVEPAARFRRSHLIEIISGAFREHVHAFVAARPAVLL